MLSSCSSSSTKEEIEYLCSNMLCVRIAQKLGIHKVMLPMSADELASTALSSLALARGLLLFFKFLKSQNKFKGTKNIAYNMFVSF